MYTRHLCLITTALFYMILLFISISAFSEEDVDRLGFEVFDVNEKNLSIEEKDKVYCHGENQAYDPYFNFCYYVIREPHNFLWSRMLCDVMDYTMLIMNVKRDNSSFADHLTRQMNRIGESINGTRFWIGCEYSKVWKEFIYHDGTSQAYPWSDISEYWWVNNHEFWEDGFPTMTRGLCVSMQDGKIRDDDCDQKYPTICRISDANTCIRGDSCEHKCTPGFINAVCSCFPGYIINEENKCVDVDECLCNNGRCKHQCRNTVGNHICECYDGFTSMGNGMCLDVNECLDNNGGCQFTCLNIKGDHYCYCPPPYTMDATANCTLDVPMYKVQEPVAEETEYVWQKILWIHEYVAWVIIISSSTLLGVLSLYGCQMSMSNKHESSRRRRMSRRR